MISLGKGRVHHSRHEGAKNNFSYPTFFVHFPCDLESDMKHTMQKLYKKIIALDATDYLFKKTGGFEANVKEFLLNNCNYEAEQIYLQTLPRMFGYAFNPVSFWYCYRDAKLEAVLVEVHNTFGERHFYWIKPAGGVCSTDWYRAEKVFHVSPFFPVDGYYKFRFQTDTNRTRVDINYHAPTDELRLATWVTGELSPLSSHSLLSILGNYGWMTPLVILRIHYQAVKLWLKKSKFYSKPDLPEKKVSL